MRKLFFLFVLAFFLAAPSLAAEETLTSYFNNHLPSVSERIPLAEGCGIDKYQGTFEQNKSLLTCLKNQDEQLGQNLPQVVPTVSPEGLVGQGYTPITGYQSRTSQFISSSATTIPVVSTKDKNEVQIALANISSSGTVKIYLNLAPGTSREEPIMCTDLTPTSFTGCTRGLVFQGASESTSSTIAVSHNAGTPIIITNIGQFYNQYVSIDGDQVIQNQKTFAGDVIFATSAIKIGNQTTAKNKVIYANNGSSTIPFLQYNESTQQWQISNDGLTTLNLVSSTGSGLSASTTKGIFITNSLIGINASSTAGLTFDVAGNLYVLTSSTLALGFDSGGRITINTSTLRSLIATTTPTADMIPIQNNNQIVWTTTTPTSSSIPYFNGVSRSWQVAATTSPDRILRSNTNTVYWDVIGSGDSNSLARAIGVTYQNTTSTKTLLVSASITLSLGDTTNGTFQVFVGPTSTPGILVSQFTLNNTGGGGEHSDGTFPVTFLVPPNYYYKINGGSSVTNWYEIQL